VVAADCDDVNVKARDLVDKREAKLRSSVDAFVDAGAPHAEVQHLTQFEIANVRAFMQEAIDQLNVINDAGAPHISAQE
jgi:GINS complex subunit 2